MVEINITLVIQLVNFIVALIVLNYVLIKPIRGILQKRRSIVDGLVGETEKSKNEASVRIKNYEAELEAARSAASAQREAIKQQGLDAEQSILTEAQTEAHNFLMKTRKEVEQEVASAMKVLRSQVDSMAGLVVARVLE